jgi:hypothetical protein
MILAVLDVVVVLFVVISVSRAVWNGQTRSRLLFGFVIAAMMIFGLISFSAAYGLAESSSFNQWALFIFLVAVAIVARGSWSKNPAMSSYGTSSSENVVGSKVR